MKKFLVFILSLVISSFSFGGSKLYVGTNAEYPPFEYLENGKVVGLDADIVSEVMSRMKKEYKWSDMAFDGLIPALQTKKIDLVIAGMSITEERSKAVNFSIPYLQSDVAFVGNKKNNITNIEALTGKTIGAELGTTKENSAKKIKGAKVIAYNGNTPALVALKSNKIDAIVVDKSVADNYLKSNSDLMIIGYQSGENKSIAVNKKDTKLLEKINTSLKEMLDDGTIDNLKVKYGI